MAQRGGAYASPSAEARAQDALVAALLALARDSADVLQAEQALAALTAELERVDGARLSAGARDVFAAVLPALRRHPSDAATQRAGALLLLNVAQGESKPETLGGAAGGPAPRRLNPGRPAEARQRADALRVVAAAARLHMSDEATFAQCCQPLIVLHSDDVRDADADVFGALVAAMRAHADSAFLQHLAVMVLRGCTAGCTDRTLRAEVLAPTVAALRQHHNHPSFAVQACALLRELAADADLATHFDRSCFESLVLGLQVQNDWPREAKATIRVCSACRAMDAAVCAAGGSAAEQAVAAGAVQRLVALLRSVDGNWQADPDREAAVCSVMLVLARICQEYLPARRLAVAACVFEPLTRVMRSIPHHALVQTSACRIMCNCCFPDSLMLIGAVANVAAAMAAGGPAAVLAAHAAHGERDERTDEAACWALGTFLAGRRFAQAKVFHRGVADALLVSMRRRPSSRGLQQACCWALTHLCPEVSVAVHRSMLDAGLAELLTQVVRQFGASAEADDVLAFAPALKALRELMQANGAVAVAQQALHAGAVEAFLASAAADRGILSFLGAIEALKPLCMMTDRLPAAAARAAACGAHRLADPLEAACPAARSSAEVQDIMQQLRRFGDLARDHAACGDDACDLCSMSRTRCSLPSCSARNGDGGVAFKRCGGCNCANFCCKEHQVSAWPRHKPLCRVRAAVEEARRELLAQSGAGEHDPT